MNCKECLNQLYQYLDRDLSTITWKEVDEHIKACRPCLDRHDLEVKLRTRVKESCCIEVCTEKLRQRIKLILDRF